MTINDYINIAINRLHLKSQNELARELNISTAYMANLKTLKRLPSEETMLKLADLAGIEKEKALIDLNLWNAKNDAARLEVWQRISKMIGLPVIILFIISCLDSACALSVVSYIVYYVYLNKKIKSNFKYLAFVN